VRYFDDTTAYLTQSGQLYNEANAMALGKVYCFGPTFRAEKSKTRRHLTEFWMVEPEMAFFELTDNMDLAEKFLKRLFRDALEKCAEDMEFFAERVEKEVVSRLEKIVDCEFVRLPYTEAITILETSGEKFEFPVTWGTDLQSEHERYICEQVVQGPVFLTDYPKDIKAFYMRLNDDGKTVAACDLLVPAIGELVGGSQREERYDMLKQRMDDMNIHAESLKWYLDLRRYGGCQHAGFGLGFERFLMYITGMQNIRDVLPFARTPRNLDY